jgi:hypothetical protein
MYLPTPNGKVVAVEPQTGKQIWVADLLIRCFLYVVEDTRHGYEL